MPSLEAMRIPASGWRIADRSCGPPGPSVGSRRRALAKTAGQEPRPQLEAAPVWNHPANSFHTFHRVIEDPVLLIEQQTQ